MDGGGGRMTELLLTSEQIGQLVAQFFIAGAGTLSFEELGHQLAGEVGRAQV